jgi:hypothetical protein
LYANHSEAFPDAIETAHFVLWRDDPALGSVLDPRWKNPLAQTDFRVKMVIFPALAQRLSPAEVKLCRDYLALDDENARKLGPPQFEQTARALLAASRLTETTRELTRHRLQVVRWRAILDCLSHAKEPWALAAREQDALYALSFRVKE